MTLSLSHLLRDAERFAEQATANADARFWCRSCDRHRVRVAGQDCPCCDGGT